MSKQLFLPLALITYCSIAFAVETNTDITPINPTAEITAGTQDSSNNEITVIPPLTLEQMQVKLSESKGITVKMDSKGEILTKDSEHWDCLHQKSSGLTWEVKTNSGLRDKTNTYTWVTHNPLQSGLLSWFENKQGKCTGNARCETADYVATINQQKLCNFNDWRLPSKAELEGLITMGAAKDLAKINAKYFPNTLASWYWTSDANERLPEFAWYVLFKNGISLSDKKHNPKHLRLVRGTL